MLLNALGFSLNNQFGFQTAATPFMEGIIDLHHNLFFFMILIFTFVFWLIVNCIFYFVTAEKFILFYEKHLHNPFAGIVSGTHYYSVESPLVSDKIINFFKINNSAIKKLMQTLFNFDSDVTSWAKFKNRSLFLRFNHGTVIEFVWTIAPCLILAIIAVQSFNLLYSAEDVTNAYICIKVIGHQWFWTYEYTYAYDTITKSAKSFIEENAFTDFLKENTDLNSAIHFVSTCLVNSNIDLSTIDFSFANGGSELDQLIGLDWPFDFFETDFSDSSHFGLGHPTYFAFDKEADMFLPVLEISNMDVVFNYFLQFNSPEVALDAALDFMTFMHYLYKDNNIIEGFMSKAFMGHYIHNSIEDMFEAFYNLAMYGHTDLNIQIDFVYGAITIIPRELGVYWDVLQIEKQGFLDDNDIYIMKHVNITSYMVPTDELNTGDLRLLECDKVLYVPAHVHINFYVTAVDVIHSWAIPSLGVKMDAIPGRLNMISTYIARTGVYYGQCSEICGINHGFMPIVLIAYEA